MVTNNRETRNVKFRVMPPTRADRKADSAEPAYDLRDLYVIPETCACGSASSRSWPVRAGAREVGRIWTCATCFPVGTLAIDDGKPEEEA